MGGTSTTSQQQNSTTAPWTAAQPALQGILGQLQGLTGNTGVTAPTSGALNNIESNYAPQVTANTNSLLQGGGALNQTGAVNQAYKQYYDATNPLASNTNYDPMSTPGIGGQIQALTDQITQNVNGSFAAAGRDGSGYNQKALGQGLEAGLAPVLTGQYNQNVQNQQGAAGNLYSAATGNAGILSGLQQQAVANQQQGATNANPTNDPTIQAELLRQGIPIQNTGLLAQIGVPIAGLGSQSTGTANGTAQASGAQQFAQIAGGLGGIFGNFGTGKAFPSIL